MRKEGDEKEMKKIGEYTARGRLKCATTVGEGNRIPLFDGKFDTGYKITKFEVELAGRENTSTLVVSGMLTTAAGIATTSWNWDDNQQVAWCVSSADANAITTDNKMYLDPDNLIIDDLFVGAYCYGDADAEISYMVHMEKYKLPEWGGTITMVRNRAQGMP